MTATLKNKPAALFAGKGMAARSTALLTIAALSFSEESTRAAALNAARKALGNAPTEAQVAATRLEYMVGRVAARLPVAELPRGKTSEGDRLEHARALIVSYAAPVKAGAKAYKLRKGMLGYRTELQHRIIRAARGRLARSALRDPARRDARKRFYREMLRHHADAQRLAAQFRL